MTHLPEMQKIAREKLIERYNTNPRYFAEYRDKRASLGIVDTKTANSLVGPAQ